MIQCATGGVSALLLADVSARGCLVRFLLTSRGWLAWSTCSHSTRLPILTYGTVTRAASLVNGVVAGGCDFPSLPPAGQRVSSATLCLAARHSDTYTV